MKKLVQTRLHQPPNSLGNCYPTVIACVMDLESPEDVIQIQEYYNDKDGWMDKLLDWLDEKGWMLKSLDTHLMDDSYYFVSGQTSRGTYHVCIYQNGKLFWDPHPDHTGLVTEEEFEFLEDMNPFGRDEAFCDIK